MTQQRNKLLVALPLLLLFGNQSSGIVVIPDQLNCDFDPPQSCRWFNGTNGVEDTNDWHLAKAIPIYLGSEGTIRTVLAHADPNASECFTRSSEQDGNKPDKFVLSAFDCSNKVFSIVATTKMESSDLYTYVKGDSHQFSAWMVSDKIVQQHRPSMLTFFYWYNRGASTIKVCRREPPGYPNALHCSWEAPMQKGNVNKWTRARALIQPSKYPFEIIIVMEAKHMKSLVAIDDIVYTDHVENAIQTQIPTEKLEAKQEELSLFSETKVSTEDTETRSSINLGFFDANQTGNTSVDRGNDENEQKMNVRKVEKLLVHDKAPARARIVIDADPCPQVACDFDTGLCSYQNVGKTLWRQTTKSIGSILMSISGDMNEDGGFCYAASLTNFKETFTLRSDPFTTDVDGLLTFNYIIPGRMGKLQVCDSTQCVVVFDQTSIMADDHLAQWEAAELVLPGGTHQLYFIASGLPSHHLLAIDNVQIWDKEKTNEMICST
uniref:MAM domain-containing protein n=1 Tax=Trichuris muris TaxID=70415 RepID=A0A5S6QEN5_TRIMR